MRVILGCLLALALIGTAQAAEPAFDCGLQESRIDDLVCQEPMLIALDGEAHRLVDLITTDPAMTPADRRRFDKAETAWRTERHACDTADDPANCLRAGYVTRIADLRTTHASMLQADNAGLSSGPATILCPGEAGSLAATFFRTDPPLAHVSWGNERRILSQERTASGARYVDALTTLWIKGGEALFEWDGRGMRCAAEPTG